MANFCSKCGNPLEQCTCSTGTIGTPKQFNNRVGITDFFGVGDSNMNNNEDPFERGKHIVPDLADPCEGEIPIRQYEIVRARSRLQGAWAEGRLQVTNKRVLMRTSGRSIIGKTLYQQEYWIDEIVGITTSKGIRFAVVDFLVALLVGVSLVGGLFTLLGSVSWFFGVLLTIIAGAFFVLVKKNFFFKFLANTAALGTCVGTIMEYNEWVSAFAFVAFIFTMASLILFSLKPSVSMMVNSRSGGREAMSFRSTQTLKANRFREILPAKDTDKVIKEIGAIVNDVQKLGDFGIEKWKID